MYLHSRWDKRDYDNFIRPGTQTEHRYIDAYRIIRQKPYRKTKGGRPIPVSV